MNNLKKIIIGLTTLTLFACGGSTDTGNSGVPDLAGDAETGGTSGSFEACQPGSIMIGCTCDNGITGAALCKADGSGLEPCQCADPGAGGTGNILCAPNRVESCTCTDGSISTMTCMANDRFGPCACDNGAGGASAGGSASTGGSGGTAMACPPFSRESCVCTDGRTGNQTCAFDGASYLPCICTGGYGGATGSGGAINTGGSGGISTGGTTGAGGSPDSGTGGATDAGTDEDARVLIQCPPFIPARECDNGRGWARCGEQPIADVPRPSIIKASNPALYWYSADGKRYVFPNDETYRTWFPVGGDCPMIYEVSDADLATVPISGNVRFKPGSYIIKIMTDPKVYTISCGGVLRWMESETVASQIYGSDWVTHLLDAPEPFFVNYTFGTSIAGMGDFDPVAELYAVESPDFDFACRVF